MCVFIMNGEKNFFCKQIKKIMVEKNLTQQDVAGKLGVAQTVVSRWVRGARNPSLATIKKLALIFDVPLGYFLENYKENEKDINERLLLMEEENLKINKEILKILKEMRPSGPEKTAEVEKLKS